MGMINDFYSVWDNAFKFFNDSLFDGQLPGVGFTIETRKGSRAFFHANQLVDRQDDSALHKIAMNPESLDRTARESMSTFVHEMAHLWQREYGSPGSDGYHNTQWASKMLSLGLPPDSATTGSKGTGRRVTHAIEAGGAFDMAFGTWKARGLDIGWQGKRKDVLAQASKSKGTSKTKYTCPGCGSNVWGAPDKYLYDDCGEQFTEAA